LDRLCWGLMPLSSVPLMRLLLTGLLLERASGAYFLVEEGAEKCFIEDLLAHQVLRMKYSMKDKEVLHATADDKTRSHCKIFVKSPSGDAIKEHALGGDDHDDALAVMTQEEGKHTMCVHCTNEEWLNFNKRKMRWSVAFDVLGSGGMGEVDPGARLVSLSRWKGTQTEVDDVAARLSAISQENDYEKRFETKFVRTSEAVNTDVAAFKILQILLVAGVTIFQLHHLSRFLKKNHLACTSCLPTIRKSGPAV